MNETKTLKIIKNKTIVPEIMLKVTALQYFAEALYKDKYEECKELLEIAKEYGAQKREIKKIIAEYVRWIKGMRKLETALNPQKGYRF